MADPAIKHLEAARAALQHQFADAERALREVERLLSLLYRANGTEPASNGAGNNEDAPTPTVREAVMEYLSEKPKTPRKVAQILTNVEARGIRVTDASLRSTLAKMTKAKILENPGRGFYRLTREHWPVVV